MKRCNNVLKGKGWLMSAFLLLIIAEKPIHGYNIGKKLGEFGINLKGVSNKGRIYTFLSSYEEEGYIESNWDTQYSPPRKIYNITQKGLEYLNSIEEEIVIMKDYLDHFSDRLANIKNKQG
ncbi:PadR family transcriptional regulator [Oceanotoga sp. DSM 15011]|jgi:DNA-binding PadR family transcriptional regulator|uniref:PadR family transcriptional regulator n=1 Tax=Oceanotoga TaxID=1255275 RepID=UPI0021F3DF2E|nr:MULTISPECIES: PadR family transcriptional regulator [Oceanotoga]MDN5343160.1 PadR family transcriptional regulator, regulatory protein PadR [Oceanotoga sp.]MDO7977758.1 PadR family transcriptional regulator [Oceanotoga teriensis]UYP00757.1 PadR family transcriptional regulator [Oceanotoga sp. DSM 15011]